MTNTNKATLRPIFPRLFITGIAPEHPNLGLAGWAAVAEYPTSRYTISGHSNTPISLNRITTVALMKGLTLVPDFKVDILILTNVGHVLTHLDKLLKDSTALPLQNRDLWNIILNIIAKRRLNIWGEDLTGPNMYPHNMKLAVRLAWNQVDLTKRQSTLHATKEPAPK